MYGVQGLQTAIGRAIRRQLVPDIANYLIAIRKKTDMKYDDIIRDSIDLYGRFTELNPDRQKLVLKLIAQLSFSHDGVLDSERILVSDTTTTIANQKIRSYYVISKTTISGKVLQYLKNSDNEKKNTRIDIADKIGCAKSQVSRAGKILFRKGLIELKKHYNANTEKFHLVYTLTTDGIRYAQEL